MAEWLTMGGHGFFVWSAYGVLALAVIVEVLALRQARRLAIEHALALRSEQHRPDSSPTGSTRSGAPD